jgi:hypothetical protein
MKRIQPIGWIPALVIVLSSALNATTIPRLTFEQLSDASELIVSGRVTDSWTAWDSDHKYIWTHYRLSVTDAAKGARVSSVEFAEPGGAVGASTMAIVGTVTYGVGDRVAIFLARMPNGYLRTTGWAQGKYAIDASGRLHGSAALSLSTLEGMSFAELKQRTAARSGGRMQ